MPYEVLADDPDVQLGGREDILNAKDVVYKLIRIPEWPVNGRPGVYRIRSLSGRMRSILTGTSIAIKNQAPSIKVEALARTQEQVALLAIVDAEGKPLFKQRDIETLAEKSAGPIEEIANLSITLSGMAPTSIEEAAGNSEAVQSVGSTSG